MYVLAKKMKNRRDIRCHLNVVFDPALIKYAGNIDTERTMPEMLLNKLDLPYIDDPNSSCTWKNSTYLNLRNEKWDKQC